MLNQIFSSMVLTYSFQTKYDISGSDTKLGFTTDTITLTAVW